MTGSVLLIMTSTCGEVDRNTGGTAGENQQHSITDHTHRSTLLAHVCIHIITDHYSTLLVAHAPAPALTALTHPAQTEWQTLCLRHVCSQQDTCRFPCPQTGQL